MFPFIPAERFSGKKVVSKNAEKINMTMEKNVLMYSLVNTPLVLFELSQSNELFVGCISG